MSNRFESNQDGAPQIEIRRVAAPGWNAWRCAGVAMLSLAGFVVVNVAGCGGGGGGGNNPITTPRTSTINVVLRDINGQPTNGTVTLGDTTLTTTAGRVSFTGIKPGNYTLRYTASGVTSSAAIVVTDERTQSFVVVPGLTDNVGRGITVRGRIFLNPNAGSTASCTSGSSPVTAPLLIRVRSLNDPGQPIVSDFIRPDQSRLPVSQQGTFSIVTIPRNGTYRVEVRTAPNSTAAFTGTSASFTIRNGQAVTDLNICANQGDFGPGQGTPPSPPATPTGSPAGTGTPVATTGPGTPTSTPVGNGTPTATPDPSVPTSTPEPTPTNTAVPTPTATTGPGAPNPGA
ncbi:MAG: hypothetical protein JWN98_2573 [Abditibacteriota bacterium]|nr:hypothetical protein [Abditibacteriota bacterium]